MKLDPAKYSFIELEMCLHQRCSLRYFSDIIEGKIVTVYNNGYADLVRIETDDRHVVESFFINRVISVPFLDSLKEKSLYKLIFVAK